MDLWLEICLLVFGGFISLTVGIFLYKINQKIDGDKKQKQEQEAARKQFEKFMINGLTATMKLCEANAVALQHGKCNGETHAALDYMKKVKREQRDFLISQGINHLF